MNSNKQPASTIAEEIVDRWSWLRTYTAARIALGRVGNGLPTAHVLSFALAHSQARDAIFNELNVTSLQAELEQAGLTTLAVRSRANDRRSYLLRPDLGRRLDVDSVSLLSTARAPRCDIVFVLSDGLSAAAVQRHTLPVLRELNPLLGDFAIGPVVIATQARVALADEVGDLLGARIAVSLIGERPGLSSPDSLGIYVTYRPRVGNSDEARNCISNIRPAALSYTSAARELERLLRVVRLNERSGVGLPLSEPTLPAALSSGGRDGSPDTAP
ncbi:ethanolamine ammonia-lyase subunit EutC [Steroidobacter flavus]|uniref:Ethanolamine ammonia-lyase small subunit n=1 Tax=Steroidobacter flavus TaxID=1842136 RepID=A0ABV8T0M6_9GAMM